MIKNKIYLMRLFRYRNVLYRLKSMGFTRVFSTNLAESTGVTPLQVRKDFSLVKISGNKKGGYNIDTLIEDLNKILGECRKNKVILIGSVKISQALNNYKGFEKENIEISAIFDKESEKESCEIFPLEKLKDFIKDHEIKTGIMAVSETEAQKTMDLMIKCGIKGILNISPVKLKKPKKSNVIINNLDFALELQKLICAVNSTEKDK